MSVHKLIHASYNKPTNPNPLVMCVDTLYNYPLFVPFFQEFMLDTYHATYNYHTTHTSVPSIIKIH